MSPVDPKPARRQPQADVPPTQIYANFFQWLPIAVLSLFKHLTALARCMMHSPLPPAAIFLTTCVMRFIQAKSLQSRRSLASDQYEDLAQFPISARDTQKIMAVRREAGKEQAPLASRVPRPLAGRR
jgi:hypothetical protein